MEDPTAELKMAKGSRLPQNNSDKCAMFSPKFSSDVFFPTLMKVTAVLRAEHTERKVKHAAFLLKRAFPSSTKYGSRHK